MRFLFLALDVDLDRRAGDAIHVRELTRNLAALGHRIDVIAEAGGADLASADGVHVNSAEGRNTGALVAHAFGLARGARPDVVYERRLTPKVGLAVSRLIGAPLFVEVNGLPDEERAIQEGGRPAPMRVRRWARRRLLRRARAVVTVSEGIRRNLRVRYGVEDAKMHVIPNGVNLDLFRPMDREAARAHLKLPSKVHVLGFTGRLNPWQGVDLLIRSLPLVRERHEAIAMIVGEGPDRGRLERLASTVGVREAVHFVGVVPYATVPAYIGAFDVAFSVKPPLIPGSPLKVREYLACGRPVVASAGTEYDFHIVEEAGAGVLVDSGNIDAVAAATASLLANDALRSEMGRRGRAYAEQHCSWAVTARRVAEVCTS